MEASSLAFPLHASSATKLHKLYFAGRLFCFVFKFERFKFCNVFQLYKSGTRFPSSKRLQMRQENEVIASFMSEDYKEHRGVASAATECRRRGTWLRGEEAGAAAFPACPAGLGPDSKWWGSSSWHQEPGSGSVLCHSLPWWRISQRTLNSGGCVFQITYPKSSWLVKQYNSHSLFYAPGWILFGSTKSSPTL